MHTWRNFLTVRAIETSKLQDEYFTLQWLWLAYWEFVYFACVLSVSIIWRPSENNMLYAYSTQLPQTETAGEARQDDVMVQLEDVGDISQGSDDDKDSASGSVESI